MRILALISICIPLLCSAANKDEPIVCIHGLMGGKWCMRYLEKKLTQKGWAVVNWDYPSLDAYIEDHGMALNKKLNEIAKEAPGKPINFVTHSMGGLVLLSALNAPECPDEAKRGEVVLIAPPLKGASYGRWLNQFGFTKKIFKEFSAKQLMTRTNFDDFGQYPDSIERMLVIAGSLGFNPVIKGKNDGTVALDETELERQHQRAVVRRGHKSIVFSGRVAQMVTHFFNHQEKEQLHRNKM
ncbi:MAG: alpha/beta hydrolase [Simkaniaceae bacterium]|nr:alpha/beta hydrolase [Simkaniaceae bacterium]